MSTRTLVLSNTLLTLGVTPRVGVAISAYLNTPGGQSVTDLEGGVFFNGQPWGEATVTASDGSYAEIVVYPGDLRDGSGNALTTPCTLTVVEGGVPTTSPPGFSYASSITVSTWYGIAASAAGMLAMLVDLRLISNAARVGASLQLGISQTAIAPNGSTLDGSQFVPITTDTNGDGVQSLWPTSVLNPTTMAYSISFPDGTIWFFTVPANPTGYQGAYAGGTTYNAYAGTKASPSDVVLSGGILYQYINATPAAGHTPASSPTFWAVWLGEPIIWNITLVVSNGGVVIDTTGVSASPNLVPVSGEPVSSPASLDDDLLNLAWSDTQRLRWLGTWSSSTAYVANDVVSSGGLDYICLTGNTNEEPPGADWVALAGSGGSGLPWFNVKTYGAVGNGSTDDTTAITTAIAAIPSGGGVLYFPAGIYKTSGGFTLAHPTMVRGDGSAGGDGSTGAISTIQCTSTTAALFTVSAYAATFADLSLYCTVTPTAGAGITVAGTTLTQSVRYERISVHGFYVNVDSQVGAFWSMHTCNLVGPVLYGVHIRNTINVDAGDWSISGCTFLTDAYNATAAIYIESSGGGRISDCKIVNAISGPAVYAKGIYRVSSATTGVFHINNCSIEGMTDGGIVITSSAGAWNMIQIANMEIAVNGSAASAIVINAAASGQLDYLSIANIIGYATVGSSADLIALTNVNHARISNVVNRGFTDLVSQSGCSDVVLLDTGSTGAPGLAVLSGSGAPSGGAGSVGQTYLDASTGDVYLKTGSSTWTLTGNIAGPTGATGATGSGSTITVSDGTTTLTGVTEADYVGAVVTAGSGTKATITVSGGGGLAELAYVQVTAPVSITATSEGAAQVIATLSSVTYGAGVVVLEFYSPGAVGTGGSLIVTLHDDTAGVSLGFWAVVGPSTVEAPVHAVRRLAPGAGARVYSVRAYCTAGTGVVNAGAGGASAYVPVFIRVVG